LNCGNYPWEVEDFGVERTGLKNQTENVSSILKV
jgi:hypothetical protein